MSFVFNSVKLIEEVKKRRGLYDPDCPTDREDKLALWKDVGASLYPDWEGCNKATAYDRVLQLQRKWRSLRDAYNRELRARRSGVRINRRVYIYFRRMSFLGGFDGPLSDADDNEADAANVIDEDPMDRSCIDDPLVSAVTKKPRKRKVKKESYDSSQFVNVTSKTEKRFDSPQDELATSVFNDEVGDNESDGDRLFLLSFLPEMRQLPVNIKMWARAQIASVMQEAVGCHYGGTLPGDKSREVKRSRQDSSD